MIKLIAALGNPGPEYAKTRHNAGWLALDAWAKEALALPWKEDKNFQGLKSEAVLADKRVWLLKPTTFMNLSGQAVQAMMNFYKLQPEEILIVHDEVAFEPGQMRLSFGGSAGGHNGVESIIQSTGAQGLWRLRLGVGRGPKGEEGDWKGGQLTLSEWVLSALSEGEIKALQGGQTQEVLTAIIQEGPEQAQNRVNAV